LRRRSRPAQHDGMAVTFSNPSGVHAPAPSYHHAALVKQPSRRLVISGQIGLRPDGSLAGEGEAQVDQALANLATILSAHGMGVRNIVKMTVFVTDPGLIPALRAKRAAMMQGHAPASTLLVVASLAAPEYKVEIEAEAVD
jgi:enamine deaminase RidA (YjgF/YER057c/UK114 family)